MWLKRKMKRTLAGCMARRYRRRVGYRERRRALALLFFVGATAFLLFGRLPLLGAEQANQDDLARMAEQENESYREKNQDETTPRTDGALLVISEAVGNLPEYVEPEEIPEEVKNIDLKAILMERFGNLSTVSFRNFFNNYYIEDPSTSTTEELFSLQRMLQYNPTMPQKKVPQILIYHTHGSEAYVDSAPGKKEDTVIGAGSVLARELRETYGYEVLHIETIFDRKADGSDDRNNSYNNALPVITKILRDNKDIEIVIDLHRDSGEARRSVIHGVSTAKIMLFNGLCRTKTGPISYYTNDNLMENLAFSFHTQVAGNEIYPGLMHRIYLKSYRYNMHLKGKYLLVELGTEKNTVSEAKAAMKPFARVLASVLSGTVKTPGTGASY